MNNETMNLKIVNGWTFGFEFACGVLAAIVIAGIGYKIASLL